jgi:L-fucose isomerase-like protein
MSKTTLGVIVGNRGFFPAELCVSGRKAVLEAIKKAGMKAIIPPADATRCGALESLAESQFCADYFKQHADEIDGIVVTLPNFGDERAVANAIRMSKLDVPVLVHAFADDDKNMVMGKRRDSFCGKMSVCNNLKQYNIPFSLTALHTIAPESETFQEELEWFGAVCRVVKALRNSRIGMIGARPAAFKTVRFSEKLLEASGISVETVDLSEILGVANKMTDAQKEVKKKVSAIRDYTKTDTVPDASLLRMAKLGVAIDDWMSVNGITASAIQCWTALEEYYGVVPCTLMSMMSNGLVPSACETDVQGLVGMIALQAASGSASALLDWNNNFGDDEDKAVVFHCSNLPASFFQKQHMDYQEIIAGSVGKENTYGTIVGRIKPGPFTYCRVSTNDEWGTIRAYCGEGAFTEDKLDTFGGYGVIEIPGLQHLLHHICENGFEHHVAMNLSEVSESIQEAMSTYMNWDVYLHHGY